MARRLTTRRTVLGNSLVLIAAEGATRATSFLTIAYLSRTLLPGGMGAVEFGFAVFALFQAVGSGGVEALLTPAAARRPDDVPTLAGRSLLLAGSSSSSRPSCSEPAAPCWICRPSSAPARSSSPPRP